jgi:hypothetical protein
MVLAVDVVGRYTNSDGVELRGHPAALRRLADMLVSTDRPLEITLSVPEGASSEPYDAFLRRIRITRSSGDVAIMRCDTTMVVTGATEKLSILARWISWLAADNETMATNDVSDHLHLEYYPGHEFLDASSRPTVITVSRDIQNERGRSLA